MSFRVCIPTAGTGSRLGSATQYLNKSLVSIANQPAICRIIDLFPQDAEFVIALGHKGHLVRDFLQLIYPQRTFFFAEVSPFEGPGSGLGLSILACKEFLQQPFVFISCDTLVSSAIPAPNNNWMGYAESENLDPYRCLSVHEGLVTGLLEKKHGIAGRDFPYIGLAGIHDYTLFWEAMEQGGDSAIQQGESYGLRALIRNNVQARIFAWFDTGTPEALEKTRLFYKTETEPHILEKANEAIWFISDTVVKFSDDTQFIKNRVARAETLGRYVPQVTGKAEHFYAYKKIKGDVLSNVVTSSLFKGLLNHSLSFWKTETLSLEERQAFRKHCMSFYRDKTYSRVEAFYKEFNQQDNTLPINAEPTELLSSLLGRVPWDVLSDGLPGRYHGDFHFENILWLPESKQFIFLDWRQDFAGMLDRGDIYYDFAKLLHGIIVSHEIIDRELFTIDWTDTGIEYELLRKSRHVECEAIFKTWLDSNGYDRRRVEILTALVYLNIAALHHYPYSLLLYTLGKDLLQKSLIHA